MASRSSLRSLPRTVLSALTPRGRGLLAAALAALIAAQVLGERDLIRIAALLAALPLVAVAVVSRTRFRVQLRRSISPTRVPVGSTARVLLRLENVSKLPNATLLMEDTLPYALGGRPRFVLPRVETLGVREATYTVHCDSRGRYPVGPLTVRLTDPFGCVEMSRSFSAVDTLLVTPVVQQLPAVRLVGEGRGGGDGHTSQAAVAGDADIAIREYRMGDDLRRIHWRATAKAGDLMVRRDEAPQQNRATVLLDTRRTAHRGDGPQASFEWACSAAASIGVWLTRRNYGLRLVTAAGSPSGALAPALAEQLLLDALATVSLERESSLVAASRCLLGGGDLVIAVLGLLDEAAVHALGAVPTASAGAVAVVMDVAEWGVSGAGRPGDPAGPSEDALQKSRTALVAAGWRVLVARGGADLGALWPEAGSTDHQTGAAWRSSETAAYGMRA